MKEKLIKLLGKDNKWVGKLLPLLTTDQMRETFKTLNYMKGKVNIYPEPNKILRAFELTPWDDVKVVILGQDPYTKKSNQKVNGKEIPLATGLAFGIPEDILLPQPSLRNIFKEVEDNTEDDELFPDCLRRDYTLETWAHQGVLLLNTALTVEEKEPDSHLKLWAEFTENVIKELNENQAGIIYLLWGAHAQKYKKFIDERYNHILESPHPSPLSAYRGFLGNKHFSQTNEFLFDMEGIEIKW